MVAYSQLALTVATCFAAGHALTIKPRQSSPDDCPGYTASNVVTSDSGLTATLSLAGDACNVYGTDVDKLKLEVTAESETRLHVKITDPDEEIYQVPANVFPRPESDGTSSDDCALQFSHVDEPFSFAVTRKGSGETLFNTSGVSLVFESQYLRLRTQLPDDPNLYGLGEHSDRFRLNTTDSTRTLWNIDNPWLPTGKNLYGSHPIYVEHRGSAGTHGVFLLNSNGMDIKIDNDGGQFLEYNTIGGVIDLYFLAGPSPKEVAQQYAEIAGLPAMVSYWHFGFHQCKYGYQDVYMLAEVVANYTAANIPLETMWTDIDYMDGRAIFSLDPERFPLDLMRELVDHLHSHQQHYVMMVDPSPAVRTENYPPYTDGVDADVFLKWNNDTIYEGVTWPGASVYPDFLLDATQDYWNEQFARFFSPEDGVDIDMLWVDMNEATNFCSYPCPDPEAAAKEAGDPPVPPPVRPDAGRPIPGFPSDFQPSGSALRSRQTGGRDLIDPPYSINNYRGALSEGNIFTGIAHANGLYEYDVHNLYGMTMSWASRNALLARRPNVRPLVITRSSWAGAGKHVGMWTGDNNSTWANYRLSISMQLQFTAIHQVPMVGSDVCGFNNNTWVSLCTRWAAAGAFQPFYRNHAGDISIQQEFYLWPEVAESARKNIAIRYKLLDYLYTAFHDQTLTGAPHLYPLFYRYPEDSKTFAIDYQYLLGDGLLISPVTDDESHSVTLYLPDDLFYDFYTGDKVQGEGDTVTLDDVDFSHVPIHIVGGSIIPMRAQSANTTTEVRKKNFSVTIAPGPDGTASGKLYLDDGDSIEQPNVSNIEFSYADGKFHMTGTYDYDAGVSIKHLILLGDSRKTFNVNIPLTKDFTKNLGGS